VTALGCLKARDEEPQHGVDDEEEEHRDEDDPEQHYRLEPTQPTGDPPERQ
jgi:hypothetical protein